MANPTKSRLSPVAEFRPNVFITAYSLLQRRTSNSQSYSTNRLGPIRVGVRGSGFKPSKVLSPTRKQLQLMMDFPSRSPRKTGVCLPPTGPDLFSSLESEFNRSISYSKLLQTSPEAFRQYRPIHEVTELTKSARKPKILKTLGVIRGIKSAIKAKRSNLEVRKGSEPSEFRDYKSAERKGEVPKSRRLTQRREKAAVYLVPEQGGLREEEDHSDPEDPSPWFYLPSKYSPLVR